MDIRAFIRQHAMPVVAVVAALITCAFVPPDAAYAGYIDAATLAKLASMLLAVGGMRASGAFQALAARVVSACAGPAPLVFALVGVTALASMFVTNDMALLALLPLAAACLLAADRRDIIAPVFVLQGLAANLCGMLLPFGNPQNIFLAGAFNIAFADFVRTMAAPFALSTLLVAAVCAFVARRAKKAQLTAHGGERANEGTGVSTSVNARADAIAVARSSAAPTHAPAAQVSAPPVRVRLAACSLAALAACVAAVVHVLPAGICLALTAALMLAGDWRTAAHTDWGLVVTFAAFFVFSGNMARIPAVQQAFAAWLANGAFAPAAVLSQLISNVPAAIVLAPFTADWQGLLIGVNAGGAGTPIASLATLIVIAQYAALARELGAGSARATDSAQDPRTLLPTRRFLAQLIAASLAFLAILLACGLALGW